MANQLGAKTLSLQPGGPLIGTTISRKLAGERFADGLNRVIPLAERHGIILAIEPEPGLFIETSQEYLDFKNESSKTTRPFRMNCDVGHLFCVGEDPAAVIRAMPEQIAHVHLEDIGANRVHQHLTPGKGRHRLPLHLRRAGRDRLSRLGDGGVCIRTKRPPRAWRSWRLITSRRC
jgi:sugar phosphate isomerase/epimerase